MTSQDFVYASPGMEIAYTKKTWNQQRNGTVAALTSFVTIFCWHCEVSFLPTHVESLKVES
jgi:hypothetical protein